MFGVRKDVASTFSLLQTMDRCINETPYVNQQWPPLFPICRALDTVDTASHPTKMGWAMMEIVPGHGLWPGNFSGSTEFPDATLFTFGRKTFEAL